MKNTAKKVVIDTYPVEQISFLKGKKIEFDSLAEMVSTRAAEIPDKPFVHTGSIVI